MNRKTIYVSLIVLVTAALVGGGSVFASSLLPFSTSKGTVYADSHMGLTKAGIISAREANAQTGKMVKMQSQTAVGLLEHEATDLGPHSANANISLTVALKLHGTSKLKQFLRDVQSPGSALYHQFLTPDQFTKLYGPTKTDVARVTKYLRSSGITVTSISPNRLLIHTSAPTQNYERALRVQINDYSLNGRQFFSTTDAPILPRSVSTQVQSIIGLNNAVQFHFVGHRHKRLTVASRMSNTAIPRKKEDCSSFPPPLYPDSAYTPSDIANAYDWPDIKDTGNGVGVTIAILSAASSNLDSRDYNNFWSTYCLPTHAVKIIHVGGDEGNTAGTLETALDIEWSGALAPGASLRAYLASDLSLGAVLNMFNQAVTDNKAQVMTASLGADESLFGPAALATADAIFMQGAAQGISMFVASGDYGSSDCIPLGYCPPGNSNAMFPSSSPYVTSVNGTSLSLDSQGNVASETAWYASGGAFSHFFGQPWWQAGPGVPNSGWRMNSDLSLNAGDAEFVLANSSWVGVYGTSLGSPQLAALFAVGVSRQPDSARLGQSNVLIYRDAALHYATDFRDITSGSNGAYQAGPGWDHPTGWGVPVATSFLSHLGVSGPMGTLTGTITNAKSGKPIFGAQIHAGLGYAVTGKDGKYTLRAAAGSYDAVAVGFGYKAVTRSVDISKGDTTTQDFSLQPLPTATISGKISDGSGHGYGLYAYVQVSEPHVGVMADVWTDPATGAYSVKNLPEGYPYKVQVAPAVVGYQPGSTTIAELKGDKTQNFSLPITQACSAPGYGYTGLGADFNGSNFPPDGWKVTNAVTGSPIVWKANSQWVPPDTNYTGGTGKSADANSELPGFQGYSGAYDTSLITPPVPVSRILAASNLEYRAAYDRSYSGAHDFMDLDISSDGGNTWRNILHWDSNHSGYSGEEVNVNLAPYLPSTGSIQLRWRYYNLTTGRTSGDFWAQVDDVVLGACHPIPGGLVYGQVTDANDGKGVLGALVTGDSGVHTVTVENPADNDFPVGTYLFFLPLGHHTVTVTDENYESADTTLTMTPNQILTRNFALEAGKIGVNPPQLDITVPVNGHKQTQIKLPNTGSGAARYRVYSINNSPSTAPDSTTSASPWLGLADLPVAVDFNAGAADPATGKVYSIGGLSDGLILNSVYVYDPFSNSWSAAPNMASARAGAVAQFLDGKLYVVDGSGPSGYAVSSLEIFDPANGTWSKGPANPVPVGRGSASAVLNGKLYIVGGCRTGPCPRLLSSVEVYDPVTKKWSVATDYPRRINSPACGAIEGKLYCAGGMTLLNPINHTTAAVLSIGFAYDPTTRKWMPIAPIPVTRGLGLFGSAYAAAMGTLIVSGGAATATGLWSNAVYAYDPGTNSWSSLPNAPVAKAFGGSACGLYSFGGEILVSNGLRPKPVPITSTSLLPGYNACGVAPSIPWLTLSPVAGTVAVGASNTLNLTFDGTGKKKYTTSKAYLEVTGNTPYGMQVIPLTVHWGAESVALQLSGSVAPSPVVINNNLAYTIKVTNKSGKGQSSTATGIQLSYPLPTGVSFVSAGGDKGVSCTAPAADGETPGRVICDMGTLAQGESKPVTITVRAEQAGKLTSHFEVTAREPNDSDKSTLVIATTVIGTADVSAKAENATIPTGTSGTLHLSIGNAGPDSATDVTLKLTAGANLKLQSAASDQGACTLSGTNGLRCTIGAIAAGGKVGITVTAFGTTAGSATVTAQATTSAEDTDAGNDVVTATVTVKTSGGGTGGSGSDGGGGALGWLALVALLGIALAAVGLEERRREN